mmetsp:Transcript_89442/g.186869  ORF Transcript_89442/g.186869 Transcript_89442/m.186869 type:complete len:440 (-) Transcript_89442:98-1417(-)|eukprot:CAMPEP_0206435000 /NCGR_PEP_ID=MMETSP0324_2-20121206/9558_1 /ASSEMBLY_ACC=CAM_ASM_000836 /TAXON_ID=2866 /ORGANISM="Crypthecodinium cohnii, Strain Seligo" /LENGTH=439 /DNA_ID=CAMNT_0053901753 /DNA_START=54 /DNA_END=1373 /DNA_ORIENTATION=+
MAPRFDLDDLAGIDLVHGKLAPSGIGRSPPPLFDASSATAAPETLPPWSPGYELLGTSTSSSSSSSGAFRQATSAASPSSFLEALARPTSFVIGCKSRNPSFWSKYPCRSDEEESCNDVHATCRNVPAFGAVPNDRLLRGAYALRDSCKPRDMTVENAAEGTKEGTQEKGKEVSKTATRLTAPLTAAGFDLCVARMTDMPYMLNNPEAISPVPGSFFKARKWKALKKNVTNSHLSESVWGHAVHGLSGTWGFDSFGDHAADYVYQVPQRQGAPSDYYICDSRTRPQRCALLGGDLEHSCAEWYDPRQCNYCEDKGDKLECQVRGWNNTWLKWARVPLYPRDLLGELYRGEFRDTYARPKWATVTLKKSQLKDVKMLPPYMVSLGPAAEAWETIKVETKPPVKRLGLEGECVGFVVAAVPSGRSEQTGKKRARPTIASFL